MSSGNLIGTLSTVLCIGKKGINTVECKLHEGQLQDGQTLTNFEGEVCQCVLRIWLLVTCSSYL